MNVLALLPLGLGLALALTLPPLAIGPVSLGILAPLPLVWLLTRGGFRFGLLAGIGFWALHLVWLPQSFATSYGVWGGIIFIPLILIKASFWAVLFGLTVDRPLMRLGGWVLLEYLTSLGDFAFPWGFLGYALVDAPGRMLAAWGGVYLLSLMVLLVGFGLHQKHYWVLLPWAALWLVPLPSALPSQTALLVQGNVDVWRKLEGFSANELYLNLTREGLSQHPESSAVVWPETAVSGLDDPIYGARLAEVLGQRELVTGYETGSANRVVRFQGGQLLEFYDKNRLVPFGEFLPLRQIFAPVYSFVLTRMGFGGIFGDRPAGSGYQTLGSFGAYICYESVFPSVARILVNKGATVLALVSNDSWYGNSFGGEQHFDMGRLRAVEAGRWMLRAGNDGVTAAVDPFGRAVARFPRHREGFLAVPFAPLTAQTIYARFGDWAVVLAVMAGLFGLRKARKRYIF